MAHKRCSQCRRKRDTKHFNKKCGDRLQSMCRDCQHKKFKRYYEENKAYHHQATMGRKLEVRAQNTARIDDHLRSHPCVDCGEADPVVLEFDHVRGIKIDNVSNMVLLCWKRIEEEICKCEVRCANCHRKKTAREREFDSTRGPGAK